MAEPLTPAEDAAVIEAHPSREKHWMRWVIKLRALANEQSEKPCHGDLEPGTYCAECGTYSEESES